MSRILSVLMKHHYIADLSLIHIYSPHHLNPMDVELNMAAGESPLSMKADFLLSLCELVVGGKEGLQPIEKTVIDRCVRLVYREPVSYTHLITQNFKFFYRLCDMTSLF